MRFLGLLLLSCLALPACLDSSGAPYTVKVEWTTPGAHSDNVHTRITYDDDEFTTHGSLESNGHSGSALISGETVEPSISICVALGNYEYVEHMTGYGCESGDYECDVETTREFRVSQQKCTSVAPDETLASVTFY
jgi:hypothetical protein